MAYKLVLETTDVDNPEFLEYLHERGISHKLISKAVNVLGAGDIIEYTASGRGALIVMVNEFWNPGGGDSDCTDEIISTIEQING